MSRKKAEACGSASIGAGAWFCRALIVAASTSIFSRVRSRRDWPAWSPAPPEVTAALMGLGLVYAPEGMLQPHIARGRLRRVLEDWCQPYSGYHLFYPSRRQSSAAFSLVVDALRYRH